MPDTFFYQIFTKLKKNKLKMLDIDFLEGIIRCKSLKLEDEDSLLYFILDLYEEDHKYARLFEYVVFQNASKSAVLQFFEKFSYEDMNQSLWFSIFSHFFNKNKKDSNDTRYLLAKRPVSSFNHDIKTVFVGPRKSGKTNIISRFIDERFNEKYEQTLSYEQHKTYLNRCNAYFNIYDIGGNEENQIFNESIFQNVNAFVIVYDACQSGSIRFYLNKYLEQIKLFCGNDDDYVIYVVCNKIDLVDKSDQTSIDEEKKFAKENDFHFFDINALEGRNIRHLFESIIKNTNNL